MAVPQLRRSEQLKQTARQLIETESDIRKWREKYAGNYDTSLLDRSNEAGWDLLSK
jgi:hypothetical protein